MGVRRRKPKTSQNEPENEFFGLISDVFNNKMKTVTCLMDYNAFHHWPKFQTKIMQNFQRSWILALEFPRYVAQIDNIILWNFQGWSFILSGISKGNVKKQKILRVFSNMYILNPRVCLFSGIVQSNLHFNMSPFKAPKPKSS